jgi:hypothetical protein
MQHARRDVLYGRLSVKSDCTVRSGCEAYGIRGHGRSQVVAVRFSRSALCQHLTHILSIAGLRRLFPLRKKPPSDVSIYWSPVIAEKDFFSLRLRKSVLASSEVGHFTCRLTIILHSKAIPLTGSRASYRKIKKFLKRIHEIL